MCMCTRTRYLQYFLPSSVPFLFRSSITQHSYRLCRCFSSQAHVSLYTMFSKWNAIFRSWRYVIVLLIPGRLDKEGSFFRSAIVYKSNIFFGEIFSERNYGKYIFYKEKETEEILLPRIIQLFQLFHRQKSRLFAASINSRTRTVLNTYSRGNMCVWKSGGKSMETPRPRCLCKIARAGGKTNITGFLLKQGCSYKKKRKKEKGKKKKKKRKKKGGKKGSTHCAPLLPFLSPSYRRPPVYAPGFFLLFSSR